jgi:hypothetical protein
MRVEVEIGTIEIDALPEGMTLDSLKAAIARSLASQLSDAGPGSDWRLATDLIAAAQRGPGTSSARPINTLRIAKVIGEAIQRPYKGRSHHEA